MSVFLLNIPQAFELFVDGCAWDITASHTDTVRALSIGLPAGLHLMAYTQGDVACSRSWWWIRIEQDDVVGFQYDTSSEAFTVLKPDDDKYALGRRATANKATYTLTSHQYDDWYRLSSYISLTLDSNVLDPVYEYPATRKTKQTVYAPASGGSMTIVLPDMDSYVLPPSHSNTTAWCLDYTTALSRLLHDCGSWRNVYGLVQLCFINFVYLQHYEAMTIWVKLVNLLCNSEALLHSTPHCYKDLMPILYYQFEYISRSSAPGDQEAIAPLQDTVLRLLENASLEPCLTDAAAGVAAGLSNWFGWLRTSDDDAVVVDLEQSKY